MAAVGGQRSVGYCVYTAAKDNNTRVFGGGLHVRLIRKHLFEYNNTERAIVLTYIAVQIILNWHEGKQESIYTNSEVKCVWGYDQ